MGRKAWIWVATFLMAIVAACAIWWPATTNLALAFAFGAIFGRGAEIVGRELNEALSGDDDALQPTQEPKP